MMTCIHSRPAPRRSMVLCVLGLYGGKVHRNLCRRCARYSPSKEPEAPPPMDDPFELSRASRGLGDSVAKLIHTITGGKIKPCAGCQRRRQMLNKLVPYGRDHQKRGADRRD